MATAIGIQLKRTPALSISVFFMYKILPIAGTLPKNDRRLNCCLTISHCIWVGTIFSLQIISLHTFCVWGSPHDLLCVKEFLTVRKLDRKGNNASPTYPKMCLFAVCKKWLGVDFVSVHMCMKRLPPIEWSRHNQDTNLLPCEN